MRHTPRQPSGDRTIQVLHHREVCREQDVEVALIHHGRRDGDRPPLVSRLHDGTVDPRRGVREVVEVACDEAMGGEVCGEDVEELHQPRGDVFR